MCRQGEFQVLEFNSNVRKITLLVEVTNLNSPDGRKAEDAHQANLNITIPNALSYSAVRSTVCPLEGSRLLKKCLSSGDVLNYVYILVFVCHQDVKVASLQFSSMLMHFQ